MEKIKQLVCFIVGLSNKLTKACDFLSHAIALGFRIYLFDVFFCSGLVKIQDWKSTFFLFKHEYNVTWIPLPPPVVEFFNLKIPELSHVFAAYSGTAAELILPSLLLIGIGARIPAIALFIFNYVAVVSYPFLWTDIGIAGFKDHMIWGAMLAFLVFHSSGKLSADYLLTKKCEKFRY